MKIFTKLPNIEDLEVQKETNEMILYKPFLLKNVHISYCFPEHDELYYEHLLAQIKHLLYKYSKKWITSERQVMIISDECISAVHFLFDENDQVETINVFQRSSNLYNLYEDIQFFNYLIENHLPNKKVELNIFVSAPHIFKGKKKKIED